MYLLAEQMGASVQIIVRHYGHVDIIKHADRLLKGCLPILLRKDDDVWSVSLGLLKT